MKCLILWHHHSSSGVLDNSSLTLFEGTPEQLREMVNKAYHLACDNQLRKLPYMFIFDIKTIA